MNDLQRTIKSKFFAHRQKGKLFMALLFSERFSLEKIFSCLELSYGPIDSFSLRWAFNKTDHYQKEFGKNLKKSFISFRSLIHQHDLGTIKEKTILWEEQFKNLKGRREINIDPGYVTDAKIVLASTKDYAHRLALSKGIYAEITLSFSKKGNFYAHPWTYPDYRSSQYHRYFFFIRNIYKDSVKKLS